MNIKLTEFVIFDVETTGLSPVDGDRIVEIAAVKVKGAQVVDKFYSLVNPQRSIPRRQPMVNNITDDMLHNGACCRGHPASNDPFYRRGMRGRA